MFFKVSSFFQFSEIYVLRNVLFKLGLIKSQSIVNLFNGKKAYKKSSKQIILCFIYTAVADRVEELEDLSQRLEEFHDNMRESESTLEKYQDKLDGHHKQGNSSRDPKHIDKIKVII